MFAFLIASLAMIGLPLTCGFVSKYAIITAAVEANNKFSLMGMIAIIISSILTLVYLFGIVIPAYIPGSDFDYNEIKDVRESGVVMRFVFILITIMIIYFGVNSGLVLDFINDVASGII